MTLGPLERGLRWEVKPTATTIMADGSSVRIHDDRLLSAALVAELDRLVRNGELFLVTGDSAVIQREGEGESEWS